MYSGCLWDTRLLQWPHNDYSFPLWKSGAKQKQDDDQYMTALRYCRARRAVVVHEEHPHWLTAIRNASFIHSFTRRTHGRLRQEGSPVLLGHFNNNRNTAIVLCASSCPTRRAAVAYTFTELHLIRGSTQRYPCASPLFISVAQVATNGHTDQICIWHSVDTDFYSNTLRLLLCSRAKIETRMLPLLIISWICMFVDGNRDPVIAG